MAHWDGQITLDPNAWLIGPIIQGINYSIGMPLHPSSPWQFTFPQPPGEVDYLMARPGGSLDFSYVRLEFEITGGDGPFVEAETSNPGLLRLIIQYGADDWVSPNGRFWSEPIALQEGHYILTVPLDPARWTNVYGQHDAAGFSSVLAFPGNVGFTFGGNFAGHGVWSEDPALFSLVDFDFLPSLDGVPTDGNDTLFGTDDADLVQGYRGDDVIVGLYGPDVLIGGFGNDAIYGNQDGDVIYGNQDADTLIGGQGDDVLYGGKGDDFLFANAGNDTMYGNGGVDTVVLSGVSSMYVLTYSEGGVMVTGPEGSDFVDRSVERLLFSDSGEIIGV